MKRQDSVERRGQIEGEYRKKETRKGEGVCETGLELEERQVAA